MSYKSKFYNFRSHTGTTDLNYWGAGDYMRSIFHSTGIPLLIAFILFAMSASVAAQQVPSGHSVSGAPGASPGEAVITWTVEDTGNLPIERSRLRYREKFQGSQWHRINILSSVMTHTLTGLDSDKRYVVQVRVWNTAGGTPKWSKGSVFSPAAPPPPPNNAPVVSIDQSGAQSVETNTVLVLSATASDDDGTIASYAWKAADSEGNNVTAGVLSGATNAAASFQAADAGVYTVTVTVTDNDDATASASTTVTVTSPPPVNQAPTVSIDQSGSLSVEAGTELTLSATASDDGTIAAYEWTATNSSGSDVSSNVFTGARNSSTVTFEATDAGSYTVTVTVTDNDDATASASTAVTVTSPPPVNQAPTVSIDQSGSLSVEAGSDLTLSATASDDGTIATYEWTATNSSGSDVSSSVFTGARDSSSVTFDAVDAGSYTVTVTVTDNDNATASASITLEVNPTRLEQSDEETENLLPIVYINTGASYGAFKVGENIELTAEAVDDDGTIESYEWTATNSSGDDVSSSVFTSARDERNATFSTTNVGKYTVTVTVTDDDAATESATADVTAFDNPTVNINEQGPLYVEVGQNLSLSATVGGLIDAASGGKVSWRATFVEPESWYSVTSDVLDNSVFDESTGNATVTFNADTVGVYHIGVSAVNTERNDLAQIASSVRLEVRVFRNGASSDASLSDLSVTTGGGDRAKSLLLIPSFSPDVYEYSVVEPLFSLQINEMGVNEFVRSETRPNAVNEKYGIFTTVDVGSLNVTATTANSEAILATPVSWSDNPHLPPRTLNMESGHGMSLGPLVAGDNALTITVTAEDGTTQDYILKVKRAAAGTTPPIAEITHGDLTVQAGTDLVFDGSSSTDPDGGDLIGHAWLVRGPGGRNLTEYVLGSKAPTERTVTFNSSIVGTFSVRLMVLDDDGDVAYADRTVTVTGDGMPKLYAEDLSAYEPPKGAPLVMFDVFLSEPASEVVWVSFSTADGTATAGEDYEATSGRLRFAPGEIWKYVLVTLKDDVHDDSDETFSLILSDPVGAVIEDMEAVATILNNDPMPAAWLARFGSIVADQALEGISARMSTSREAGFKGSMAGQSLTTNSAVDESTWENKTGVAKSQAITVDQLFLNSSFSLTDDMDSAGGTLAFWGRGAQTRFDGQEGELTLDGSVSTWMIGTDYDRDTSTVGLSLLRSKGEGDYASGETAGPMSGQIKSSLSAAVPWALWRASERVEVWGATGFGSGDLTLTPNEATPIKTDLDWKMAAAGLRTEFSAFDAETGKPGLALTADALWAQTSSDQTTGLVATESDATRVRVGLEGNWIIVQEEGKYLKPQVEVGIRHDGGDGDVGAGVDIGGGISWNDSETGLSVEVEGRTLLTHESDGMKESGYAATLAFDSDPLTERGMSISLRQDWGAQSNGGLDALFATDPLTRSSDDEEARELWTAEAAYGYSVLGGRFTSSPHTGFSQSTTGHEYKIGWRLTPEQGTATDLSIGLRASRLEKDGAEPDHRIGFEFTTRW